MKRVAMLGAVAFMLAGCAQPYTVRTQTLEEVEQQLAARREEAKKSPPKVEEAAAPAPIAPPPAPKPEQTANNAILLEACNNIAESAKRLECFKAIQPAERSAASGAKAEVVRAFTDLKSILNAGTSYNSYSTQIEIAVKALGNFQSSAQTDEDKRAAAQLQESIDAHKDAQLFWQRDISWYARTSNSTAYPGGLPIEYTGTAYLVPKYGLRTQKSDFWGISTGLPRAQTLRAIWKVAEEKASGALSSLN